MESFHTDSTGKKRDEKPTPFLKKQDFNPNSVGSGELTRVFSGDNRTGRSSKKSSDKQADKVMAD